jgi:molybdopterin molybdotransferase
MMTYDKAIEIIRAAVGTRRLDTETVSLAESVGRICAGDILAGIDIQPFDNSAMDGFAVHGADLAAASAAQPVRLEKAGTIAAGEDTQRLSLERGTCWHVMTGAGLPAGTDAIVPIEEVSVGGGIVSFQKAPALHQHIRRAGEDFRKGFPLGLKGKTVSCAHILPLATLGIAELPVFKKPRVLFMPTGTEVVDDLRRPLRGGEIYNSNRYYAESFLKAAGADVVVSDTIRDDTALFEKALHEAGQGFDLIISSGAVSAGSFDFVRGGLENLDAGILYHKIGIKPGKPNLLARLPSGTLYFGLPGNPVATAVGLRFLAGEALRLLAMREPAPVIRARALNDFRKKAGLRIILKSILTHEAEGMPAVTILEGQESFRVSPFLTMNGWVHAAEESEGIQKGDIVEVHPLSF